MPIIRLENVYKSYENGARVPVLEDANLIVNEREILGIFAPSGYGKSTIIHLIAGLDKPDKGRVVVNGVDVSSLDEKASALFRRMYVGIVFQFFNLFPTLTALENVMLPMELQGVKRNKARERALELLELMNIADKANRFPSQLSGGEQQRVAIARALANNPIVLLADEPTGNLDEENALLVFDLFKRVNRELGVTIVLATHDIIHARQIVDRSVTIKHRRIVDFEG